MADNSLRMPLAEKGRHLPPPVLDAPLQRLSEEVQSWPDIVAATHWHFSGSGQVDGADFYRGEEELGHLHLEGDLHLATPPALGRALISAGLAQPFLWAVGEEWVLYHIRARPTSITPSASCAWLMTLWAVRRRRNCSAGCLSLCGLVPIHKDVPARRADRLALRLQRSALPDSRHRD